MSQNDKVLSLLAFGERLDRQSAMRLGVQNITARIADLRKCGVIVETTYRDNPTTPRPTAVYVMRPEHVTQAMQHHIIRYDVPCSCYRLTLYARF